MFSPLVKMSTLFTGTVSTLETTGRNHSTQFHIGVQPADKQTDKAHMISVMLRVLALSTQHVSAFTLTTERLKIVICCDSLCSKN